MDWLANAIKKPFAALAGADDEPSGSNRPNNTNTRGQARSVSSTPDAARQTGTPQQKSFWKPTQQKLPGTVKQISSPSTLPPQLPSDNSSTSSSFHTPQPHHAHPHAHAHTHHPSQRPSPHPSFLSDSPQAPINPLNSQWQENSTPAPFASPTPSLPFYAPFNQSGSFLASPDAARGYSDPLSYQSAMQYQSSTASNASRALFPDNDDDYSAQAAQSNDQYQPSRLASSQSDPHLNRSATPDTSLSQAPRLSPTPSPNSHNRAAAPSPTHDTTPPHLNPPRLPHAHSRSHSMSPSPPPGPSPNHRSQLSNPSASHSPSPSQGVGPSPAGSSAAANSSSWNDPVVMKKRVKLTRFLQVLEEPNLDIEALRKLSWSGISVEVRAIVWQLLLGYLPANRARRQPTLIKRRQEYQAYAQQYYEVEEEEATRIAQAEAAAAAAAAAAAVDETGTSSDVADSISSSSKRLIRRDESEQALLHQIRIDVLRMKLFQHPVIARSLERVLYVWAVRHPASGYVQGINDVAAPFYVVFLCALCGLFSENPDELTPEVLSALSPEQLNAVEADSFWCLSKLLDGIQDHYTFAQPGIQRLVFKLKELTARIDQSLHDHLDKENVQFTFFGFRWMNCLLTREMSLPLIIRTWDTYLAEPNDDGFRSFHVYVCAAFLMRWSKTLKAMEFQDLMQHLQNPPTADWTEKDIESLLAQAYVYQSLFQGAPKHLQ